MPQQQFKGYSQDQMGRIASKLGHTGGLDTFDNYLNSNPSAFSKYNALKDTITQHYARGGMVKSGYDDGGLLKKGVGTRVLDPIQQAYMDNVGRLPNDAGYNYYKNSGKSIEDIKADLSYSDEGKQYGVTKDNESIQNLFKEKLGRFAGQSGQDYYANKVSELKASGKTSEEALASVGLELDNSTEGQQRIDNPDQQRYVSEDQRVYDQMQTMEMREGGNNRRYTQQGPQYNNTDAAVDALGRTGDNTAADTAAIQQIYQNQLGRAGDTTGAAYYQNLMAGGTGLDSIRGMINDSEEGVSYDTTGQQRYVKPNDQIATGVTYRTDPNPPTIGTPVGTPVDTPVGTPVPNPSDGTAQPTAGQSLGNIVAGRATAPGLVAGAGATATGTTTGDNQILNSADSKLEDTSEVTNKDAALMTANAPTVTSANTATTEKTKTLANTDAAQSSVPEKAQVTAQTQATTNVGAIDAAQSSAIQVDGAPTRTLQTGADGKSGELVNPVADAQKAAAFTEQITAAQGDPSSRATVQGQLATLMTSFDEGKTPAWAAGAMRNVTAQMSARGIGSSSMAGQALIQAALEASLPIATADAQTFATFEMTNLNNRQQRVMLAAQQRATFMGQEFDQAFQSRVLNSNKISEVANMRFTGDQQIALENSQAANTMQLNNLSNKQAIVMASASTMSQLEVTSLNNRQQAEVQNAQSFLDMDMSNLSNSQQAVMFDAQSRVQSMLTDAAAVNATEQFNATSKNQTDQFFEGLKSQISQFNASQSNAQAQFNTGETNTIAKFNKEISNQRDQFNAQNRIVIDQSNAQWRRNIATADTVAINRANEINAKAVLDISNSAYNDLWQDYKDKSEWAWTSAENGRDRFSQMAIQKMSTDASVTIAQIEADYQTSVSAGEGLAKLFLGDLSGSFLSNIF